MLLLLRIMYSFNFNTTSVEWEFSSINNQNNEKLTIDDIMRIAVDGQDFNYFVPAPILKHDMKNAKGYRIPMSTRCIKTNIEHLCNIVIY